MSKISDEIEEFILEQLSDDLSVNLSRNELADFFGCAPSQINYVLATRFTPLKGYDVESRRGGGGYIKIIKLGSDSDDILKNIVYEILEQPISYNQAIQLLEGLENRLIVTESEYNLIKDAISPKALASPVVIQDKLRAKILQNILLGLMRR